MRAGRRAVDRRHSRTFADVNGLPAPSPQLAADSRPVRPASPRRLHRSFRKTFGGGCGPQCVVLNTRPIASFVKTNPEKEVNRRTLKSLVKSRGDSRERPKVSIDDFARNTRREFRSFLRKRTPVWRFRNVFLLEIRRKSAFRGRDLVLFPPYGAGSLSENSPWRSRGSGVAAFSKRNARTTSEALRPTRGTLLAARFCRSDDRHAPAAPPARPFRSA